MVTGPFAELSAEDASFPPDLFTTREQPERPLFLYLDGLIRNGEFVERMQAILLHLQSAWPAGTRSKSSSSPWPGEPLRITNLLQCRAMAVRSVDQRVGAEPPACSQPDQRTRRRRPARAGSSAGSQR